MVNCKIFKFEIDYKKCGLFYECKDCDINPNLNKENDDLTINDVLDIIEDKAQWCREEGEADMRYIVHLIQHLKKDIEKGKSKKEILDDLYDE